MPADSRLRGKIPFQHRPGIDVMALPSAGAFEKMIQLSQLLFHHLMIIIAPRISRDAPSCADL